MKFLRKSNTEKIKSDLKEWFTEETMKVKDPTLVTSTSEVITNDSSVLDASMCTED